MDAFSMEFRVFPESGKLRFDCAGASGLSFRPLVFWLRVSTFTLPFLDRFLMVFGLLWELRFTGFWYVGVTAGTSYYCLLRLIQKVHYTTVLAPLRGFSLPPKGFFRRTRGRIPESTLSAD